jgi:hypothetical protein
MAGDNQEQEECNPLGIDILGGTDLEGNHAGGESSANTKVSATVIASVVVNDIGYIDNDTAIDNTSGIVNATATDNTSGFLNAINTVNAIIEVGVKELNGEKMRINNVGRHLITIGDN